MKAEPQTEMNDVTAVAIGSQPGAAATLDGPEVQRVIRVASLREIGAAASAATTPLLWIIEDGGVVSDSSLRALLRHAPGPAASVPVDAFDVPVDSLLGRFPETEVRAILDAISKRCVPLRHTHVISLLVGRAMVLDLSPPDPSRFGTYAGSEWTSRLFACHPGMLVPQSRVQLSGARSPGSPVHALRIARHGVWQKGEALSELRRSVAAWAS